MPLSRNEIVASCFAAHVEEYDLHARLQAEIADALAELLPNLVRPRVLEAGCGTGFLTRHLLDRYADGDFLITDLAPEMVAQCKRVYQQANGRALHFAVMDGEAPTNNERYDLIALSMTLQWFSQPLEGLKRLAALLNPGGRLLYATLAPDSFPEWRASLDACGLRHGLIDMPSLPYVLHGQEQVADYASGVRFLKGLRSIGATTPRPGYRPLPPGKLRAALRRLKTDHGARVTWRIVYGVVPAGADIHP